MKKNVSKKIAFFVSLMLILSFAFFSSNLALALTWSTPEEVTQNAGFFDMIRDSSGKIHLAFHNKTENEVNYLENDTNSETLTFGGNNRIAQRFVTLANMGAINKIIIQDSTGSTLDGSFSIHADDSGYPSGVPINGTSYGITLNHGSPTEYNLSESISVSPSTTYWLIFNVGSGSGTFDGGTNDPANQCMYYDGSDWQLSSNLENMYFVVGGYEGGIYYIEGTEQNWSTPINVSEDNLDAKIFSITTDNNNEPHLVYNIRNVNDQIIYTKKTGTSWSAPEVIASNAQYYYYSRPVIITDSDNHAHVVYFGQDPDTFNYGLYYTTNISGSWSSPIEISEGTANYTFDTSPAPALNIDSSDNLHVAYYRQESGMIDVYYIHNVNGSWSSPVQVSTSSANTAQFPSSLAIDNDGLVHIAYNSIFSNNFDIYYANNSGPDNSWTHEKLTSNNSVVSIFSSIVLSDNNQIYIAYKEIPIEGDELAQNMNIVFLSKEKGSNTWNSPEIITNVAINMDETLMAPPILMYGSLHLGYLGQTIVYYTQSQFQEDSTNGTQQPTDQQQQTTAKKKLTELPETGNNFQNFLNLLLPLSFITPYLVEKIKLNKNNLK